MCIEYQERGVCIGAAAVPSATMCAVQQRFVLASRSQSRMHTQTPTPVAMASPRGLLRASLAALCRA